MSKPLLTAKQATEIDQYTIKTIGIGSKQLMANAGHELFKYIRKKKSKPESIAILCGSGNNGGDGLVLASYLFKNSYKVTVYHTKDMIKISPDSKYYADQLIEKGFKDFIKIDSNSLKSIKKHDIIIDALLGTGFFGSLDSSLKEILRKVNRLKSVKIAVDIPSGLNASNGNGPDAFQADTTITIGFAKRGLYINDGLIKSGNIKIIDIGFPKEINQIIENDLFLQQKRDLRKRLPKRNPIGYKSSFGRVLVIGGSRSMSGSVLLTGISALRSGAGLVKLAVPKEIENNVDSVYPELMVIGISDIKQLNPLYEWADVIVFGMGLGVSEFSTQIVNTIITHTNNKIIIDADGLNLMTEESLKSLALKDVLLTPHLGEFSKLSNLSIDQINENIFNQLKQFSLKYQVNCLLKGKSTIICSEAGKMFLDNSGNTALSTAGSGDVLSGLIAGFSAQGISVLDSARLSAFLHGKAAEIGSKQLTEYSFIASDILKYLPSAIKSISKNG